MNKKTNAFSTIIRLTACVVVLLAFCGNVTYAQPKPKALLIMLDGFRADAMDNMPIPNINKLRNGTWQPGYKGACSVTGWNLEDARPSSAANHASIATGVTAAKTKVYNNGDTKNGNYAEWPSWLARVATMPGKNYKALYVYSWGENNDTAKHPAVEFHHGTDAANADYLAKLLATPEAPDAILYFIDLPDHGGHGEGFYPHSNKYHETIALSDAYIGKMMDAIASRPTFAEEDWMISVTADHGGYGKSHGMYGSTANTVPVLVASKHVKQGVIPGIPRSYDLPVTALAHFGIDVKPLNLDGKVVGQEVSNLPQRPLSEGLVAYLPFDAEVPANVAPNGLAIETIGDKIQAGVDGGKLGKCLRIPGGENVREYIVLKGTENLKLENGNNFTAAMWVRVPKKQVGDPAILCNKDWRDGKQPGFVLCGAAQTDGVHEPGFKFNFGRKAGTRRTDMGTFDVDADQWSFYAISITAEGVVCYCQGKADGHFYWMVHDVEDAIINSGMNWNIGQDGTTNYRFNIQADVDDFALWNRGLSIPELRKIFEAGKQGQPLSVLLK
ncbi:MAG: alkaline phosphatase family protein [Victivallales bacterium]|nr:alkaline phosphatase family protein [Victivallales bacterium]